MKILLVVDMQNDFIDGSLGTPEAEAILPGVVRRIKDSRNELILFTKDTHSPEYLTTQEGNRLPVEHCIAQTPGWRVNSEIRAAWHEKSNTETVIDPELNENTLYKDTFGSRALAEYLGKLDGIEEIELVGLCTDVCVISNALLIKAFLPEVKLSVDARLCAGVTPESHETALKAMRACQIDIKNYQ